MPLTPEQEYVRWGSPLPHGAIAQVGRTYARDHRCDITEIEVEAESFLGLWAAARQVQRADREAVLALRPVPASDEEWDGYYADYFEDDYAGDWEPWDEDWLRRSARDTLRDAFQQERNAMARAAGAGDFRYKARLSFHPHKHERRTSGCGRRIEYEIESADLTEQPE